MSKILYLVPDDSMLEYTKEVLSEQHNDITVGKGYWLDAITVAEQFLKNGGEVIIARAGTAREIRNAVDITVVDIPITGFDVIRAVQEARSYGTNIAVITISAIVEGIDYLASILGVKIKLYEIEGPDEVAAALDKAIKENADVILGGVSATNAARSANLPCVLLKTSRESILLAAKEAKYVKHALQIEKAKRSMLNTVLNNAYEGIIVIDQDQAVTEFNPSAEKFTGIDKARIVGHKISKFLPELDFNRVLKTGKEDLHCLLKGKHNQVLCNKVPIFLGSKVIGAVTTMQDITKIQEMEAQIRQEIYSKGHIANFTFDDILGSSSILHETIDRAKKFARTESNILILGETGSGKEVFAQSIHNFSSRAKGPFVAINCAALPPHLLESELFGYVAGAFTGASKNGKPGLFEVAHNGTIFLDEIAEIDYTNQGRLLRVLQEKTVVRLGSDKVIPVNVRIIAATNKDLKARVTENSFRDDLYFRLNVLRLTLPPLREHTTDIADYVHFFIKRHTGPSQEKLTITDEAITFLMQYPWPGNIRELQNTIERAVAIRTGDIINEHLLRQVCGDDCTLSNQSPITCNQEMLLIDDALTKTNGRLAEAAKLLDIDRTTLWRKMRKLGIQHIHKR